MRHFAFASGALALAACAGGPKDIPPPPTVTVTSPARSLVQNNAGNLTVTGTVTPNEEDTPITSVMVNNVAATVNGAAWTASIEIEPGASLIHTVATDADGGTATDTRSVEAGELRPPGANIDSAITVSVSANAFTKISGIATDMIKQQDFGALIAPMQPMQHSGDESGPDCLYDELFVDNLTFSDANLSLVPVAGGLSFTAEIDGLDVPAHANFAVACVSGSESLEVTADKVVVTGTLSVSPNGMNGFTTTLDSPDVQLTNFQLNAGGIPGTILNMIDMNNAIAGIIIVERREVHGPDDEHGARLARRRPPARGARQEHRLRGRAVEHRVRRDRRHDLARHAVHDRRRREQPRLHLHGQRQPEPRPRPGPRARARRRPRQRGARTDHRARHAEAVDVGAGWLVRLDRDHRDARRR